MLIIVHENLLEEAQHVQRVLQQFNVSSTIIEKNLDSAFVRGKTVAGFLRKSEQDFVKAVGAPRAVILTPRDVLASENSDSWVFGYNRGELFFVVTARLKGKTAIPQEKLTIPEQQYLDRITFVVLHEIAHAAVSGDYLKPAAWVANSGFVQELGGHCTDSRCTLYEIVDLVDPKDGFMRLGNEKKRDVGLDGLMTRRYPAYFCSRCLPQIKKYLQNLQH